MVNNISNKLKFNNCNKSKSLCKKLNAIFLAFERVAFNQVACNYYFSLLYSKLFINTLILI